MSIEGGLVDPFGVNIENQGIAHSFVEMNTDAAGLGARRIEERLSFFAELPLFPGKLVRNEQKYAAARPASR